MINFAVNVDHVVVDDKYTNATSYHVTIIPTHHVPLPETPHLAYWLGEWQGSHGSAEQNLHFTIYEAGECKYGAIFIQGHAVKVSTVQEHCIAHQGHSDIINMIQCTIINTVLTHEEDADMTLVDTVVLSEDEIELAKIAEAETWVVRNTVETAVSLTKQTVDIVTFGIKGALFPNRFAYIAEPDPEGETMSGWVGTATGLW